MDQAEFSEQHKIWNKVSSGWKKWDFFITEWLGNAGAQLLEMADVRDNMRVLDVAAGSGEPGLTIARKFPACKVIGTDVSEEMTRIALEKASAETLENYTAVACDSSKMPFQDNYFDIALSRFGVMYFSDMHSTINEMKRMLKSGGRIALNAWSSPEKNSWATLISSTIHEKLNLPAPPADAVGNLFRCSKAGTLSSLLEQTGFGDIEELESSGEVTLDSAEQYWNIMTEIAGPIAAALAKASKDEYVEIKETVLEKARTHEHESKVKLNWAVWTASGTK